MFRFLLSMSSPVLITLNILLLQYSAPVSSFGFRSMFKLTRTNLSLHFVSAPLPFTFVSFINIRWYRYLLYFGDQSQYKISIFSHQNLWLHVHFMWWDNPILFLFLLTCLSFDSTLHVHTLHEQDHCLLFSSKTMQFQSNFKHLSQYRIHRVAANTWTFNNKILLLLQTDLYHKWHEKYTWNEITQLNLHQTVW